METQSISQFILIPHQVLIGSDLYDNRQTVLFDEEEMYRVNAFDWKKAFPKILGGDNPGFDAVIGNPPYGFHQIHHDDSKAYFKLHFQSCVGSYEQFFLFYEASLKLLKRSGLHGFIVPVTWLTIPSANALRTFVLNNFFIKNIVWLPELVFKNAQVNTLVSIIENGEPRSTEVLIALSNDLQLQDGEVRNIEQSKFIASQNIINLFEGESETLLIDKIDTMSSSLSEIARPCSGYNPYEVGKAASPEGTPHTKDTVKERPYHSDALLGADWKPDIIGRSLSRYRVDTTTTRYVKYGSWLAAPRKASNFIGARILVQEITGGVNNRIVAAYYEQELYHSRDIIAVKFDSINQKMNPLYVLGIINSWMMTWRHHRRSPKARKSLFPKVLVADLESLPIRTINFDAPAEVAQHDRMVSLVEQMLALNAKLATADATTRTLLTRQIETTDAQIDRLVYELYDLTAEEIALVENAGNAVAGGANAVE